MANSEPSETVRWGDQTWEEMMIGRCGSVSADEDLQADAENPAAGEAGSD